MSKRKKLILKMCTPKELASMYGISHSTLNRRLKPYRAMLGPKQGQFYDTRQLEFITEVMGRYVVELKSK